MTILIYILGGLLLSALVLALCVLSAHRWIGDETDEDMNSS